MTVQERWPSEENNIGSVRAILSGDRCRIDWGDGTDLLYEADGHELHAQHTYFKKNPKTEETYVIRIYSDEENITGIYAECGDLSVIDIDTGRCRSLRYFASLTASVGHFDLRTNPELTKVDIEGDFDGIADFSNSLNLKELSINFTYARSIDLSNCSRLEKFRCTAVLEPVKITLPKYFPLKEFTFDESTWWCFTKRQFKKIVSVIEHNGGKMVNKLMLREYPHSEFFLQPGQQVHNHPTESCHHMQELIKMDITPFREGYIACIAMLLDGGSCEIDWGDRHKSRLEAKGREWLYGVHVYSQSIPRQVTATSEAGKIIGLIAENLSSLNGVAVDSVDISRCRSLRYFAAGGMSHLNVGTNPELRIIDLSNCYCTSIDFSNSTGLEHLYIGAGLGGPNPKVQSLDLAKCKRLQTLGIRHSTDLTDITIAEDSPLMQFTCDDYTPLNEAAVRNLQQVIARNGGQLKKSLAKTKKTTYKNTQNIMETNYFNNVNEQAAEYRLPSLDLLNNYSHAKHLATDEEVTRNCDGIRSFLLQNRIENTVINVTKGPVASMYKIALRNVGVRETETIAEDLRWSHIGANARITAVKGMINMEKPNRNSSKIPMRDVIGSADFPNNDYELPVAVGTDITGTPRVIDLADAGHILIGGSTGQGKTMFMHTVIASLLYAKRPDELKFVLIDPKMVEFGTYAKLAESYLVEFQATGGQCGLPHSIISNPRQVEAALASLCNEMNHRYALMGRTSTCDIRSYNSLSHSRLPHIVVIIDEYYDYIYNNGRNIMTLIMSLAQKGGAAGIHLIMASQRPVTYVINRLAQSGFSTKIAFRVVMQVDSRAILGTDGAEMLVGNGDMLYKSGKSVERLHGAFISDPEISRLVDYVSSADIPSRYVLAHGAAMPAKRETKRDPMFDEAAKLVAKKQSCTPAILQMGLAVGYNRACNIIAQLDDAGIVNVGAQRRQESRLSGNAGCQSHMLPRRRPVASQQAGETPDPDVQAAQHSI